MKYEFHVGDYVETQDGEVGYITILENLFVGWGITVQFPDRIKDFVVTEVTISVDFKRIGQYEFTKKDEGKIRSLVKSWILEDVDGNGEYYFDSREVIKKINELVEVVNRLENKV